MLGAVREPGSWPPNRPSSSRSATTPPTCRASSTDLVADTTYECVVLSGGRPVRVSAEAALGGRLERVHGTRDLTLITACSEIRPPSEPFFRRAVRLPRPVLTVRWYGLEGPSAWTSRASRITSRCSAPPPTGRHPVRPGGGRGRRRRVCAPDTPVRGDGRAAPPTHGQRGAARRRARAGQNVGGLRPGAQQRAPPDRVPGGAGRRRRAATTGRSTSTTSPRTPPRRTATTSSTSPSTPPILRRLPTWSICTRRPT